MIGIKKSKVSPDIFFMGLICPIKMSHNVECISRGGKWNARLCQPLQNEVKKENLKSRTNARHGLCILLANRLARESVIGQTSMRSPKPISLIFSFFKREFTKCACSRQSEVQAFRDLPKPQLFQLLEFFPERHCEALIRRGDLISPNVC